MKKFFFGSLAALFMGVIVGCGGGEAETTTEDETTTEAPETEGEDGGEEEGSGEAE